MKAYIPLSVTFEGVQYHSGAQSVDDDIAARMIAAGFAKAAHDAFATHSGNIFEGFVVDSLYVGPPTFNGTVTQQYSQAVNVRTNEGLIIG